MTRPLLLVGAGGFARETAEAVRSARQFVLVGFADDDRALVGTELDGLPVLGPPEVLLEHDDWMAVLCPGPGAARAALADRLGAQGVTEDRWATVVHAAAVVPASCAVGRCTVVLAGTVLTTAVRLGRHVAVMAGCVLTHDDVVEDFATLCARVALAGRVHVGAGAYLGAGCLVREHLTVGDRAVLGMGAVVLQDVPADEVWVGVPARRLRGRPARLDEGERFALETKETR